MCAASNRSTRSTSSPVASGRKPPTPPVGVCPESHVGAVDVIVRRVLSSCKRPGSDGQPRRAAAIPVSAPCRAPCRRRPPSSATTTDYRRWCRRRWWRTRCAQDRCRCSADRAYSNPAARAAPTLPASVEMKCTFGAEPLGKVIAAVVAGIEDDDDQNRHRGVHGAPRSRRTDSAANLDLIVRRYHHHRLLQPRHAS